MNKTDETKKTGYAALIPETFTAIERLRNIHLELAEKLRLISTMLTNGTAVEVMYEAHIPRDRPDRLAIRAVGKTLEEACQSACDQWNEQNNYGQPKRSRSVYAFLNIQGMLVALYPADATRILKSEEAISAEFQEFNC